MEKSRIGIILGSTREGRVSPQVGAWVKKMSDQFGSDAYEIVDIRDYNLPLLGTSEDMTGVLSWNKKLSELDGFIFVVSEYNHSISAALKNALDSARDSWINKAAGIVSYGSAGGARATEHLRSILSELQIAHVRSHTLLSLFTDFENGTVFKPQTLHKTNLENMLVQLSNWSRVMKTLR